jgi:hypothetical protein
MDISNFFIFGTFFQKCPVQILVKSLQANDDGDFKDFMGFHNLDFNLYICDATGFEQLGVMHEPGQDTFCTSHEVRAMEDIR